MGAKPGSIGRDVKDSLDRGAVGPFPGAERHSLDRACVRLFPSLRPPLAFPSREAADAAVRHALGIEGPFDPVLRGASGTAPGAYVVARAFPRDDRSMRGVEGARLARVETGCPSAFPLGLVACSEATDETALAAFAIEAPGLLAFAHASCAHEAARLLWPTGSPKRRHTPIDFEGIWARAGEALAAWFERDGPWLYPRCPRDGYPLLFSTALRSRFLLSRDWDVPSVIPLEYDAGEIALLAKALSEL
jgi:hypothetical protein